MEEDRGKKAEEEEEEKVDGKEEEVVVVVVEEVVLVEIHLGRFHQGDQLPAILQDWVVCIN